MAQKIFKALLYSQETAVKSAAADAANENQRTRFNQIFALKKLDVSKDFDFSFEVDRLGQREGENYPNEKIGRLRQRARPQQEFFADTPADAPEHLTEKISRHMDACAGIAILPTKYPFFRGYKLAEQLCDAAKKSMRELANDNLRGSSWLDFAILHGEQAPTLEQIRSTEYRDAR